MKQVRGLSAVLVVVAGLLLAILPIQEAAAQTNYEVVIGARLKGAPAEANLFFPGEITIHQGDTLHFTSESFHTATLLPEGQSPDDWFDENGTHRTSQPYSIFQTDPDEGEHAYKAATALLLPSRFDCGGADQDPCEFDGSQPAGGWRDPTDSVLNSGAPVEGPLDFSVTITADPGTELWAMCLVHPSMQMKIQVVGDDEEASDQAKIDQEKTATIVRTSRQAAALHRKFSRRSVQHSGAGGTTVWEARVGIDTKEVSLFDIYPSTLAIKAGDRVRWNFDLYSEDHTASFPSGQALDVANGFPEMKCDLDTDSGPLPDQDPAFPPPLFCPGAFYQLELDFPADFVVPVGDGSFEGEDFETSGVRGPENNEEPPYEVVFPAPVKEAITVICIIHPVMDQKIQIR